MRADPFYCNEFHGVYFRDHFPLPLSKVDLPDADFYEKLYSEVEKQGEVPNLDKVRRSKEQTADIIAETIRKHHPEARTILSWGAGLGIVEIALVERHGFQVEGVEPGECDWGGIVPHYKRIDESSKRYDVVMEVSVLYSCDDDGVRSRIREFRDHLNPGGLLLIAEQDSRSVVGAIRGMLMSRLIYRKRPDWTLWGYLRGPNALRRLIGGNHLESRYYGLAPDWSYKPIGRPARVLDRQLFSRRSRMQFHIARG